MRGRRMCTARGVLDHAFFFGVAVEADDRAQPARHRRRAVPRSFGSREAFDVDATNLEQAVLMPPAPRGELAQVQRVGVAGIAAVAGEEPERVVCSTLLITGRYRSTAVVVVDMVRDLPVIVAGSPDTSMPIGRASRRVPPTFGRDIRARRLTGRKLGQVRRFPVELCSVKMDTQLEFELVTNRNPVACDRRYRGLHASRSRHSVTDERGQVHAHR
jgi:hypothetical protein